MKILSAEAPPLGLAGRSTILRILLRFRWSRGELPLSRPNDDEAAPRMCSWCRLESPSRSSNWLEIEWPNI